MKNKIMNKKNLISIIIIILIIIVFWVLFIRLTEEPKEKEALKEVQTIEEKVITNLSLINTFGDNIDSVYVYGNYAFLEVQFIGLKIVNISNPSNPFLVGIYEIPDDIGRFFDIYVSGNYVFLEGLKSVKLSIIDISDPSNPFLTGVYNEIGLISDIHVSGDYIFISQSLEKNIHIVNISDPSNPFLVTIYPIHNKWSEIHIFNNYLFIVSENKLQIIDISNPANPFLVSDYEIKARGGDIYVSNNYVFLISENIFQIIDISNPSNPFLVSDYEINGVVGNIYISGNYAFLLTSTLYILNKHYTINVINISDPTNIFQVINMTNPLNPNFKTSFYELPNQISSFVVSGNRIHGLGNYIYVATMGSLKIVEINKEIKENTKLGIKPREWIAILGKGDLNNDKIPEIFGLIRKGGGRYDSGISYYISAISWDEDNQKFFEIWRSPKSIPNNGPFNIFVGDLDGNNMKEILIESIHFGIRVPPKSTAVLFEYGGNDYKINNLTLIINKIMEEKIKNINNFWSWSYKGIKDYNQDGIKEIIIETTALVNPMDLWGPTEAGLTILITWEDIQKE